MSTRAGDRLLWMVSTERMPSGRRWPRTFDARLVERIVEEFVPRIEAEAREAERIDMMDEFARNNVAKAAASLPPADPSLMGTEYGPR